MPLTKKGNKIMAAMKKQYGGEKGKSVFYASRNAGKITGVDPESRKKRAKRVDTNPGGEYADATKDMYNPCRVTKMKHGAC